MKMTPIAWPLNGKYKRNRLGERKQFGVRNIEIVTPRGIRGNDLLSYPRI